MSFTCSGMTIMKIFFSLSDRMYLTKAQPVPIRASVMNSSAPLSLGKVARRKPSRVNKTFGQKRERETTGSQVSDVIHDGPAFDGVPLCVDEVIVDLKDNTKGCRRRTRRRPPKTNNSIAIIKVSLSSFYKRFNNFFF